MTVLGNKDRAGEPQKFTRTLTPFDGDFTAMEAVIAAMRTDLEALKADKSAPPPLPASTVTEIRNIFTGGKSVPPNVDWVACPLNGTGTGLVEARLINGTVQLRGTVAVKVTSPGSGLGVRKLNSAIPNPQLEVNAAAFAVDTGTSYRLAGVRIGTDGGISVSAPTGKFDTVQFDGISYQVF
jgi:hypothetical protein